MIVIKATLRDETRRLTFDSDGFPHYEDIQERLRAIFNLPSTAHPFWVNVLFFPDDAKPSRIKFKQHVCDASEYEAGQQPFLRLSGFPNPVLVFTVLLSSDTRLNAIHGIHRASTMQNELRSLDSHIVALEEDMSQRHQLLVSLESKLEQCRMEGDNLGISFWTDRVEEKRHSLPALEEQLRGYRVNRRALSDELQGTKPFTGGVSLQNWIENQERHDAARLQETSDELTAWQIENNDTDASPFPPLESIFGGATRHGMQRPMWRPPPSSLSFPHGPPFCPPPPRANVSQRPARDLLARPDAAAREVGAILDRFLVHFQGQLVDTLDGFAARLAPAAENDTSPTTSEDHHAPHIPGAFIQPSAQPQSDAQVQTGREAKPKSSKVARHKHIICDGCGGGVHGMRYSCERSECDWDLCGSCLPRVLTEELHPPSHKLKAMLHRGLEDRIKFGSHGAARTNPQSNRHAATCDICTDNIVGVRYKCLTCDWDTCSGCSHRIATAHPGHAFVKIHKPADYLLPAAATYRGQVTHPYVVCDGCDETIRGVRYKCLHPSCSDDAGYDLCERCEAKPIPVHPEDHPLLKIKKPLRVDVQSSFDAINTAPESSNRDSAVPRSGLTRFDFDDIVLEKNISGSRLCGKTRATPSRRSDTTSTTSNSTQTDAYERGSQYAQAMDALVASMSASASDSIRVPGGYLVKSPSSKSLASSVGVQSMSSTVASSSRSKAASVMTEEEEMAALVAPMTPKVAPVLDDRSVTPVPVGAFPKSPKLPSASIPKAYTHILEPSSSSNTYKTSGPTGRPFATPPKEMAQVKSSPVTKSPPVTKPDVVEEAKDDPIISLFKKKFVEDPTVETITDTSDEAEYTVVEDPIQAVIAAAAAPATPPTKEPISPSDIFTWVRHSTIPTGTTLPAGAEFTKTWTVRHYAAGSEFAFDRVRLVHKTEGLLGAGCKSRVVFKQSDIVDGADMEVSLVGLVVPDLPGKEIVEMWRFEDDKGVAYGQPLRVRINVEEVTTGESSLASSAVVLPEPTRSHTNSPEVVEHEPVSRSTAPSEHRSSAIFSMDGADLDEIEASSAFSDFSDLEDEPHRAAPNYYSSSHRESSTALSEDYDFLDEPVQVDETTDDDM